MSPGLSPPTRDGTLHIMQRSAPADPGRNTAYYAVFRPTDPERNTAYYAVFQPTDPGRNTAYYAVFRPRRPGTEHRILCGVPFPAAPGALYFEIFRKDN